MNGTKLRSTLNGIVGNYLEASQNDLAIDMAFYHDGEPLDVLKVAQIIDAKNCTKICVLVHGLTDNERTWKYNDNNDSKTSNEEVINEETGENTLNLDSDYGRLLMEDFGLVPYYLRYNTGLHISTNGQKLNCLMKVLVESCQAKISDIVFLCHSMGGLVTRSALHYALKEAESPNATAKAESTSTWVDKVKRIVFLGTPHQGSPWEQLGHVVASTLDIIPISYMKLAGKVANLRSDGIKDLRYGYICDEDWKEHQDTGDDNVSSDSLWKNTKTKAKLPNWIHYNVVTGTITQNEKHIMSLLLGDGLVRKDSAEGRSQQPDHDLGFSSENFAEFPGIGHCQLTRNQDIYDQIKTWISKDMSIGSDIGAETSRTETAENDNALLQPLTKNNWKIGKGVASLVQDSVLYGSSAVQDVHLSLSGSTFDAIGVVSSCPEVVSQIRQVHDASISSIYAIIQGCSYGVTEIAKQTCVEMECRQDSKLE